MGRQRAHVALELGHAEAMAGEPQAAVRLSEAAEWASAGLERPTQALATGRALFALGRPDQAMSVFDHALGDVTDPQSPLGGQLRAGRAAAQWLTQLPEGGGVRSEPPPATADTPGDRALLALHAMEGAIRGAPCSEVRDLAGRALAFGALLADETADGLTYYLAAAALAFAEDLQAAEMALTAAVEEARGRGSVLGFATASHVRAMAILMRGRVLDAASDARNALGAEPEGWRLGLGGARLVLALTSLEAGEITEAEQHLDDAEVVTGDAQPLKVSLLTARGQVRMARGDAQGAVNDFMTCGAMAERAGVINPAIAPWRSNAARALAATGDTTEAIRLADVELKLAESFGAPAPIGRALRVGAALRDADQELDMLRSAVEVLQGSQAALERARAFVDLGAALRRSGRLREARPHLRAGLELAQVCGAEELVKRAGRETKAAGARPRRTALSGPDALTARERQVATLAAEGLSNREIADMLVVTVKTVEWHLKHSYRKLGVKSRVDLREFFGEQL
jgi:DNA-binding CsgD family transcriptional regulator